MSPKIHHSWKQQLSDEFDAPYFLKLKDFLEKEKQAYTVYPPGSEIFAAFDRTPFEDVKVVLLGQDPYHGPGQAHGLSFSVPEGVALPPSLKNIYKELHNDLGIPMSRSGNLSSWASQGVLLLNAVLTVRHRQAGSHQKAGWENFTDAAIRALSQQREGIIFMLWGNFAKSKQEIINPDKHHILTAAHPSPFSAHKGFFGCRHFSKANALLQQQGKQPIHWHLA